MNHWKTKAAQAGSRGGENSHQLLNINTTGMPAQPRRTPMSDQGSARKERVEQLRLFSIDGAWAEPYIARAKGNVAATSAAARERMTQ